MLLTSVWRGNTLRLFKRHVDGLRPIVDVEHEAKGRLHGSIVRWPHRATARRALCRTFTPHRADSPARAPACLACTHFHGRFYAEHLGCQRDGGRYVVGVPAMGCACWQREPGADDV